MESPNEGRSRNVTWHEGLVPRAARERRLGQRGCVVWLTGLSGSGKSTLARALEAELFARGRAAYVLDGDNVRHGLNSDLGFSRSDRDENIRRLGEVAALFADAGIVTVTSFISPSRSARERARGRAGAESFVEVHVHAPLEVCESRDPKGLYAKARAGELDRFTGVSAPYEPPEHPDVSLDTSRAEVDECVTTLVAKLEERGLLSPPEADSAEGGS